MRLVAIAGETRGAEEFMDDYWPGELYFDERKDSVFKVLNAGRQSKARAIASYFTGGKVKKALTRAKEKGYVGNFVGEGLKLGGVWAFSPKGFLVYEHKEKFVGDTLAGSGGNWTGASWKMDELRGTIDSF